MVVVRSCRWDYDLLEVDSDGELDLYYDNSDVTPFAMSPKDLKLIESIHSNDGIRHRFVKIEDE